MEENQKSTTAEPAMSNDELNSRVFPALEDHMREQLWHRARFIVRHHMGQTLDAARRAGLYGLPKEPTVEQIDTAARELLAAWGEMRTRNAVNDLTDFIKSTF